MNFIISSSILSKNLQTLSNVIGTNNSLPILNNFLFEIKEGDLYISASDLETTICIKLEIDSKSENSSIAISSKLLLEMIKSFADQPLTFKLNKTENLLEIISSYGKYELAYLNGNDFPKPINLFETNTISIPSKIITNAIQNTSFACNSDDMRPILNGMLFQLTSSGVIFVGTDAHKLVKYQRTDIKSEKESEFIIPKKTLTILKNTLSNVDDSIQIDYNENNAKFRFSNIVLICRLIEGKYPDYEAVIPKENPNVLTIKREEILGSIKRVSIFSNKTTHQVQLKITGLNLKITAEDIDYSNKAEETFNCQYTGDDIEIGFNSRFFAEILTNLQSNKITLNMSLPDKAGVIIPEQNNENEHILMLLMPVLINE